MGAHEDLRLPGSWAAAVCALPQAEQGPPWASSGRRAVYRETGRAQV